MCESGVSRHTFLEICPVTATVKQTNVLADLYPMNREERKAARILWIACVTILAAAWALVRSGN